MIAERALAGSAGKCSLKGSNFRGKALYRRGRAELQRFMGSASARQRSKMRPWTPCRGFGREPSSGVEFAIGASAAKRKPIMKYALFAAIALALASAAAPAPAEAKGCLKGAVVGGVAGHYAGHHGVMGAIGGCIVGHHMANEKAKEQAAPPAEPQPAPKPNG
jgi:hypothetical protein